MIAVLVILAALLLLALLPIGIRAVYRDQGAEVAIVVGPLAFQVFPRKPKAPRKQRGGPKKANKKAEPDKPQEKTEKKPAGGRIPLFRELLALGLEALGCIRRKLILRDLILHLTVGGRGEDAAASAVTYGRAWAAVGALTPVLENSFRIQNRDVQVFIDFCREESVIYGEGCVLLRLGDLIWMAGYYGIRGLKLFLRQKKKGGIQHGTSNQ